MAWRRPPKKGEEEVVSGAPPPSTTPVADSLVEAQRDADLAFWSSLAKARRFDDAKALLPIMAEKHKGHPSFVKTKLDLFIAAAEWRLAAEAAEELIALLDPSSIVAFFGVPRAQPQDGDEPTPEQESVSAEVKKKEKLRESLISALLARAQALSEIVLAGPVDDATKAAFLKSMEEVRKWQPLKEETKHWRLLAAEMRLKGRIGAAIKLLKKQIGNSIERPPRSMLVDLLKEIKWEHWVDQWERRLIASYPKNFVPF